MKNGRNAPLVSELVFRVTPLSHNGRMMKLLPKPSHGSLEWHNNRRRTPDGVCAFGASDAPILMGNSPYTTRAELYVRKVRPSEVSEETDRMYSGNILEGSVIDHASRQMKTPFITPAFQYWRDRFVISCDGVDDEENPSVVIEAKTTAKYQVETLADLPIEWKWQGWAQQFVTGAPVIFSVLDRRQLLRLIELPSSSEAMDALAKEAEEFGRLVDTGGGLEALLEELGYEEISSLYDQPNGIVELPSEAAGYIAALAEAREAKGLAEEREKAAKDALARLMLDGEVGTINGVTAVTWKMSKGRESLDQKALKAAHPEIVSEFTKQGAGFRVMRLTGKGE